MDGAKANLVIVTDPPYNVDVEETAGKIMNDNMADDDFLQVPAGCLSGCMYSTILPMMGLSTYGMQIPKD
jgi:hypothetical protein